ncbi:UDP-N-acetylmuramoyl-L-alanine--D-glutamate ligase [Thermosediminibacter oceani]|uniref:UDP-N-acetylmuramoylalanine--D-glutamate ligase n=1 Tax=Thermosediminibacter oceani (strain ATCC BAA-1034 / DSM 16646 / JW/IW-1228P) TaxID=555079 RepID=D9S2T5_THEOJ|nr:UDP-N-acetylmuramoyl-L-alanine--D-glutamate ligase [Thermosediminibacter oceani]ADL07712.1 UDP-N-acetylmuramoylalanine--D-glutamate ligase [Thermosediminibacter oceani DSM 16646]
MELRGKKVLIVGLARSGVAAAIELSGMGAKVTANDIKTKEQMEETVEKLSSKGIELVLGGHPLKLLDDTDLIVVSPGVPSDIPLLKEARERNIPVVSELEVGYWFTKAPIIAITGTNGKTTTTTLIGEILKNDGKNISVAGNIGTPLIQEADKNGSKDYIVVEVSSFQLENIVRFKPKISVILNITEDHLNRHKTFENYIEAKARILENQDEEDFTVLNYDDPIVASLEKRARSKIVFFSRKQELQEGVYVKNDVIVIRENGNIYPILKAKELGIKGSHNLENALAAVAVAWITKANLNNLAETLKDFHGVEHRLEYVDTIDGVKFINDSKGTNPDAAQKALEAVDGPIILIAGGYDKKVDFRPFVRSFFGKVKKVVLIGATADQIERTAREEGFFEVEKAASMREAVEIAKRSAEPGDTVLLSPACASWDMFSNFEERGRVFKEAVRSLKA